MDDKTKVELLPCHVCADTMIHGQTYTIPREYDPTKPSCGKVYTNPAMAGGAMAMYQPQLVDCWRCKGTGWVDDRRSGNRRTQAERRAAPPIPDTPISHALAELKSELWEKNQFLLHLLHPEQFGWAVSKEVRAKAKELLK